MDITTLLVEALDMRREKYVDDLKACRRKFSENSVHDVRVSARRLLALFDLFRATSAGMGVQKVRRVLKSQLDSLDNLRDTQVMQMEAARVLADLPDIAPFLEHLKSKERRLLRVAGKHVKTAKPSIIAKPISATRKALLDYPDEEALAQSLYRVVDEAFAIALQRYNWVNETQVATLHRLRIAFKQFRYMLEVVSPIVPDYPPKNFEVMHDYQTRLGAIQDAEVMLVGLAEFYEANPYYRADVVRHYYQQRYQEAIQVCLTDLHQIDTFWRLTLDAAFPWVSKHHKRAPRSEGLSPKEQAEMSEPLSTSHQSPPPRPRRGRRTSSGSKPPTAQEHSGAVDKLHGTEESDPSQEKTTTGGDRQ